MTDNAGRYVIEGIRPPDGTYTLRETTVGRLAKDGHRLALLVSERVDAGRLHRRARALSGADGDRSTSGTRRTRAGATSATGTRGGSWSASSCARPAGRFDLLVDGAVVVPAAGDGGRVVLERPPGRYDVAEAPTAGTDGAAYESSVRCKTGTRPAVTRAGTVSQGVALRARADHGDHIHWGMEGRAAGRRRARRVVRQRARTSTR